ncbi:MAG: hypothetical protein IKH75_23470 [Ruminococcus sp.]|nr:hypothetical protein [Ruminococcus sp.]
MANRERTSSIQYEVRVDKDTNAIINGSLQNKAVLPEVSECLFSFEEKANKTDCIIAAASGIVTGLLDVFGIRKLALYIGQELEKEQINQIIIKIASLQGCTTDSLADSICFLKKNYSNLSNNQNAESKGEPLHHLLDFSHHASSVGLMCSILAQFTENGCKTNTSGNITNSDISNGNLNGKSFEEKIVYGVIYWALHLASNTVRLSNNPNSSTGIPKPLLALIKKLSELPIFKDKTISHKESFLRILQWIKKLFNATAFQHTGYNNRISFDLSTEVGIADSEDKQLIPAIINQCIVRAFYFMNRLYHEIRDGNIHSINELKNIEPGRVLPINNQCVIRMITISSGTITALNTIDAAICDKIRSENNIETFAKGFIVHIEFIGIANFAITIKEDANSIYSDMNGSTNDKEPACRIIKVIEAQTIEIDADMDNTPIYRHRFDELLKLVKRIKDYNDDSNASRSKERRFIFDTKVPEFDNYTTMVSTIESWIKYTVEKTILNIFDQNNIAYEPDKGRHFSFIQTEFDRRIGYVFITNHLKHGLNAIYEELRKQTNVDEVRFFFAVNAESQSDNTISIYNNLSKEKYSSFFRFSTLKEFFNSHIKNGEYEVFKEYVDEFNEKAKNIIAYKTVIIPTDTEIAAFKSKKSEMLRNYDYESLLPEDIYDSQKAILKRNFIERGTYKALIGESDFSESFIASEWNYDVIRATGVLDQTGVVAGFLKSIEQLLYAVIKLSINKNKRIRLEKGGDGEFNSDNEEHIDSTLGSLSHFVKDNGDVLDVNNYVKKYIVDTLFKWTKNQRNGHFHKDNLHDPEKVAEIREQTLLLYYLILGGFSITNEQFPALGIVDKPSVNEVDEEKLYRRFKAWASPVILYDVSNEAGAVGFTILPFEGMPWEISLQALKDSTETDHRWNWSQLFSTSVLGNDFSWDNSPDWEYGKQLIIQFVERFLGEDTPASKKLKTIPKVVIGGLTVYKTFENNS